MDGLSIAHIERRRAVAVVAHAVGREDIPVVGEIIAAEVLDRRVLLACAQVIVNGAIATSFVALDGNSVCLEDTAQSLEIAAVERLD